MDEPSLRPAPQSVRILAKRLRSLATARFNSYLGQSRPHSLAQQRQAPIDLDQIRGSIAKDQATAQVRELLAFSLAPDPEVAKMVMASAYRLDGDMALLVFDDGTGRLYESRAALLEMMDAMAGGNLLFSLMNAMCALSSTG